MSSNLEIQKVCGWCGDLFTAKKTSTKYCSHQCNSKAYKAQKRKEAEQKFSEQSISEFSARSLKLLQEKEYLKVTEVAEMLSLCRQTVYNLIHNGYLKASRVSSRMTRIRRMDIDEMFKNLTWYNLKVDNEKPITEFYTLSEIAKKFNVSENWIFKVVKENGIPKILKNGKSYISKHHIDSYFKKKGHFDNQNIMEWYSTKDVCDKYNMTLTAVYSFVSTNNIPKKKNGRAVFYSQKHFDIAKGILKPEEPEYYTVKEAMEKFNLSRDSLYAQIRSKNIPKIKEGKFIKIFKPALDEIFEKPIIH